jgi:hypothetical protein
VQSFTKYINDKHGVLKRGPEDRKKKMAVVGHSLFFRVMLPAECKLMNCEVRNIERKF